MNHGSKTVPKAQTQTTLLDTFECVEANGGDVVFAALADGGDIPVAVTSVYSEHDLRAALRRAGYARDAIDNAFAVYLRGDSGRRAARLAESRTHDHPVQVGADSVATGQSDADTGANDSDGLDRGEGILADGGMEVDDSVSDRLATLRRNHDRITEQVEDGCGRRPFEVSRRRGTVSAKIEDPDDDTRERLDEAFDVERVGGGRREEIRDGQRTVTRYRKYYLDASNFEGLEDATATGRGATRTRREYPCDEDGCGKVFDNHAERARHIQDEHMDEDERPEGAANCSDCPGDADPQVRSVPDPRTDRHREQQVCPRCGGYLGGGRFR